MNAATVLVSGYMSIDWIDTPESSIEGAPGGAALYASLSALNAGAKVRLTAALGDDWPERWLRQLAEIGVDTREVIRCSGPSRRARLSHLADGGRRSQHEQSWWDRTAALAPPLSRDLKGVSVVAAGPMPADCLSNLIHSARTAGVPIIADTSPPFAERERDALMRLIPQMAVFAPSLDESRLLVPGCGDDDAAVTLSNLGPMILQKRGSEGAVFVSPGGPLTRLPAPKTHLVDPTGAGDATMGAFAAGIALGVSPTDAARDALVAGARAVSGRGPSAFGFTSFLNSTHRDPA